jgi:plastocyanin
MRLHRLLPIPLALAIPLAAAAPAIAADHTVEVPDYFFQPAKLEIDVGDRVIWSFSHQGESHTTTAKGGQADKWDSGLKEPGESFARTFSTPGRFDYICRPHPFMTGEITVGADTVANTLKAVKTKRSGNRVTVGFTLNEPANVTFRIRGATRRTVKRGRLRAGERSFTVKRLNDGSHTGTLVAVDDFDKRDSAKKSFVIR